VRSRFLRVQEAECLRCDRREVILGEVLRHGNTRGQEAPQFDALWKRKTFNFVYDMRHGGRHEVSVPLVTLTDKRAKLTPQKPGFFMRGALDEVAFDSPRIEGAHGGSWLETRPLEPSEPKNNGMNVSIDLTQFLRAYTASTNALKQREITGDAVTFRVTFWVFLGLFCL